MKNFNVFYKKFPLLKFAIKYILKSIKYYFKFFAYFLYMVYIYRYSIHFIWNIAKKIKESFNICLNYLTKYQHYCWCFFIY